jgi:hypothetical protein
VSLAVAGLCTVACADNTLSIVTLLFRRELRIVFASLPLQRWVLLQLLLYLPRPFLNPFDQFMNRLKALLGAWGELLD